MNKPAPMPALIEQHTIADKKTKTVVLAGITTKGLQLRVTTDKEAIARYAEAYAAGEDLPPIVVFDDGAELYLADGHHRMAAAEKAGKKSLDTIIKKGTRRDAILYAMKANDAHGVPLNNDDKRHKVTVMLSDPEWRKKSDRWVGEAAGVNPHLVGKVRKSLPKEQQSTVRESKDGVTRDTKNIAKQPKWPKLTEPAAVMRQMVQVVEGLLSRASSGAFNWRWNERDICENPQALNVVPLPTKGRGVFAVIKLAKHSDGKWYVGYQYGHHAGEMFGPVQRDKLTGFSTWQSAVRREIMDHLADVWREHFAPKEAVRWLEDLAQALEHHEQNMAALAGPSDETEEPTAIRADLSTPAGRAEEVLHRIHEQEEANGGGDALGDTEICDRILLAILSNPDQLEGTTLKDLASITGLLEKDLEPEIGSLKTSGNITTVQRSKRVVAYVLTDEGRSHIEGYVEGFLDDASSQVPREPEELNQETLRDAGVSDLPATPPPMADDTEGARILKRTREILADRLLKGKDQCSATSEQLVSLGLVIGIPFSADDEPWSDDLVARCWRVLSDRLKAEVADRLTRPDAHRLPPLAPLASWWGIDIRAVSIQAERAVKGG